MKITTLLIMLVLSQAQADEPLPYPEFASEMFPADHWELTLVWRDRMEDIDMLGAEKYSRTSCLKDGIARMLKDMESVAVKKWGSEQILGFICEYVTAEE